MDHHAYLTTGDYPSLMSWLGKHAPDANTLREIEIPGILIDDARMLAARMRESGREVLVIRCDTISSDAQQTLLKSFEEPHPDKTVILHHSSSAQILSTLASRCQSMHFDGEPEGGSFAEKFLSAEPDKRLGLIKKNSDDAKALLHEVLEALSRETGQAQVGSPLRAHRLGLVAEMQEMMRAPHISAKMLLEYVALGLEK